MVVPILKQGSILIASVQSALTDRDLNQLRDELAERVGRFRCEAVVIDVGALDVLDSYGARSLSTIAQILSLRGVETIVVGIQPDVAFAMVQLGLTLDGVRTALDLDDAIAALKERE